MSHGSNVEETNQGPETAGSRGTQQQPEEGRRSDGVKEGCLALSISSLPHEGKETDAANDAWER